MTSRRRDFRSLRSGPADGQSFVVAVALAAYALTTSTHVLAAHPRGLVFGELSTVGITLTRRTYIITQSLSDRQTDIQIDRQTHTHTHRERERERVYLRNDKCVDKRICM